jgi:hypothetical protein
MLQITAEKFIGKKKSKPRIPWNFAEKCMGLVRENFRYLLRSGVGPIPSFRRAPAVLKSLLGVCKTEQDPCRQGEGKKH